MKQTLVALFVFIFSSSAFSQAFEFRVLASRGDNSIKTKGSEEWTALKTGSTIFSGSELKLGEGGYLGLMHKTGKTMEVKTPKVHSVDALSKDVMTRGSSVASQYGEFLLAKMNKSSDADVSDEKLNNLNVTGAVSRAVGDEAEIEIFLPQTSKVLNFEDAIIKWKDLDDAGSYQIDIENLYSESIASEMSENNFYDLAASKIDLASEGGIFIKVMAADGSKTSNLYAIELVSGSDREDIQSKLAKLKSEISGEDITLQKLVLAMFYEENKLFLHAFSCYNEILKEYPDVDFYKSAYLEFVERNKDKF